MKKLLIGLAAVGAGVFAYSKWGKNSGVKIPTDKIPDPVKDKLKETVKHSEHMLKDSVKMSSKKIDEAILQAAKAMGQDEVKARELMSKVSFLSAKKRQAIGKAARKINSSLA
jgi:hypothetical protein